MAGQAGRVEEGKDYCIATVCEPGDEFWFGAENEEKIVQECGGERDELVKFIFDSDDAEHAPVVSEEALADPMTEITLESILEQKAKEKIRGIILSTLEGWRVKSGELRRRSRLFTRGRARSVLVNSTGRFSAQSPSILGVWHQGRVRPNQSAKHLSKHPKIRAPIVTR